MMDTRAARQKKMVLLDSGMVLNAIVQAVMGWKVLLCRVPDQGFTGGDLHGSIISAFC